MEFDFIDYIGSLNEKYFKKYIKWSIQKKYFQSLHFQRNL